MNVRTIAFALSALAAAGCSGGGGSPSGGGATNTPTNAPTLAPTTTPTTTPTNSPTGVPAPSNPTTVAPGPAPTVNELLAGAGYQSNTNPTGWLPTAVALSFQYPVEYGYGGTGQTIAVLGPAPVAQSDMNEYAKDASLPMTPTVNNSNYGSGNATPSKDEVDEATLDVETVAGLASYATIDDVVLPSLDDESEIGALGQAIQDLHPSVISISFGGCESDSTSVDQAVDNLTQEAAATGITIAAAAGDNGPQCLSNTSEIDGVAQPASDPYVVGVGGSEDQLEPPYASLAALEANMRNPAVWNDSSMQGGGVGGGGVSGVWSIPSYQNAPGIVSTAASSQFRNVPDVSLPASNDEGPSAIYAQSNWVYVGGTSWSAPEFAAMQAEINQQCGANRWGLPDLYRVYYQAPSSFIDITHGNITASGSSLVYAAGTGYDNASGLGLPFGEQIAVQDGC